MYAKGLSGRRWFGRVVRADLACPNCNRVSRIRKGSPGWEPRVSRWTCPGCHRSWYLGMLAWPARGRVAVPEDVVPDVPQGKELARLKAEESRAAYKNLEVGWAKRRKGGPVNVVIEGDEEEES